METKKDVIDTLKEDPEYIEVKQNKQYDQQGTLNEFFEERRALRRQAYNTDQTKKQLKELQTMGDNDILTIEKYNTKRIEKEDEETELNEDEEMELEENIKPKNRSSKRSNAEDIIKSVNTSSRKEQRQQNKLLSPTKMIINNVDLETPPKNKSSDIFKSPIVTPNNEEVIKKAVSEIRKDESELKKIDTEIEKSKNIDTDDEEVENIETNKLYQIKNKYQTQYKDFTKLLSQSERNTEMRNLLNNTFLKDPFKPDDSTNLATYDRVIDRLDDIENWSNLYEGSSSKFSFSATAYLKELLNDIGLKADIRITTKSTTIDGYLEKIKLIRLYKKYNDKLKNNTAGSESSKVVHSTKKPKKSSL